MSRYFRYYPKTQYKFANSSFTIQKSITNISLKTVLIDTISQNDPYQLLRYTVKENERAEDVAYFYYDDPGLSWLVYFANDIIDPYTQWVKPYEDFVAYFRKKYSSQSLPEGTDPIEWGQNTLRTDNIVHWKNNDDEMMLLSPDSYIRAQTFDNDFVAGNWTAVRYYEYENNLNEEMRNILLINSSYVGTAIENLKRLLND